VISIHSLRAEGDLYLFYLLRPVQIISIHSLRAEGDLPPGTTCGVRVEFQSTPSVRRETRVIAVSSIKLSDFNPLPPCGGRRHSQG